MSDELKPCPFCGGDAVFDDCDDGSGGIRCSKCGFQPLIHASWGKNKNRQQAISEWNRRPEPTKYSPCTFTVIDRETGTQADCERIAKEEWAKGLIACDIAGWALLEDGYLVLMDDCDGVAYPIDQSRFLAVFLVK